MEEDFMKFLNEKHEKRFNEACEFIDKEDKSAVAACYLLTVKKRVWNQVQECIKYFGMDLDMLCFEPKDCMEQALFNAAYDLYNCSDAILLRDLTDPVTIPDRAYFLILYMVTYLRLEENPMTVEVVEPEFA